MYIESSAILLIKNERIILVEKESSFFVFFCSFRKKWLKIPFKGDPSTLKYSKKLFNHRAKNTSKL